MQRPLGLAFRLNHADPSLWRRRWRAVGGGELVARSGRTVLVLACALAACTPGSDDDNSITVVRDPVMGDMGSDDDDAGPPRANLPDGEDLYVRPPPPGCGDFELNDDEACDDGNRDNGDGCSGNCLVVENGYECPEPGAPCVLTELCGDSRRIGSETCDDGNDTGGDGCSNNCQVENGFACPTPGEPCISTVVCSDGFVATGEECDDGNAVSGDGCSEACALESGWVCPIPGARCLTDCGDGLVVGLEQCDDGNATAGDGCSDNCRLEPGRVCDVPGEPCGFSTCQNGVVEGLEQCDDENEVPFDGCSAACVNEPRCGDVGGLYTCQAVCGDGMKFPEEACDDGNTSDGDGCSGTCQLELGFQCVAAAPDLQGEIALPVIYRDFPDTHPQFEVDPGAGFLNPGMVLPRLNAAGKPVYDPAFVFDPDADGPVTARAWTLDGRKPASDGAAPPLATPDAVAERFAEWYVSDPAGVINQEIIGVLPLLEVDDDIFQFAASGETQFFPIDGLGFGNQGRANNFHFTSEVRQWFEYQGGELLEFSGDDDVWVFVNGQLTVDLGGIHLEALGSIELLGPAGEDSVLCIGADCNPFPVAMNPEGVNEIVVFQAERHVTLSNYTLTLRGFNAPLTTCESECGDGVVTFDETCDDGELNGTGYNFCSEACTLGPRCGDGVIQSEFEQCDNGANRDGYLIDEDDCAPGCVTPPRCGDGNVDGLFGEQCDDGVNDNSYGGCSPTCELGPRCGDEEVNGDEACDDGNRRNGDGCNVNCAIERDPF